MQPTLRPIRALDHIYLKTSRAHEHLKALDLILDAFREDYPCVITPEEYPEKGRYIARFELKDPPDRGALLAGEFAFGLRSALDHVIFQLSLLNSDNPGSVCQFPVSWGTPHRRFAEYTQFVPDEAKVIIDSFQPYHRGNAFKDSPLWRLDRLCNIDKHRRLSVHSHGIYFKVPALEDVRMEAFDNGGVVDMPIAFKDEFEAQFKPGTVQCAIFFGDDLEGLNVQSPELGRIYKYVCDEIIPAFSGFFAKSINPK